MPLADFAKGGWHPKGKDGGRESWRGDFKGINQIATKLGRGKDNAAAEQSRDHQSTPLSALKDPALFAPPPKHIAYHGAIAVPNAITPDRRGWGAPASETAIAPQQARIEYQLPTEAAEEEPAPPPVPYRANTTGLRTDNLPKPPARVIQAEETAPLLSVRPSTTASVAKPKPQPPPRLPPRQNSQPNDYSPAPPPVYSAHETPSAQSGGYLSQNSLNRLGQAGVSVAGFGIGRTAAPNDNPAASSPPQSQQPSAPSSGHMSELQSRFSRMTAGAPSPQSSSPTPRPPSGNTATGGTTWAQKQKALQTVSSFHQNPSSVSFSDARDAASTANNFRQRHGDQVASGLKTAQKYGVVDKVGSAVNTISAASGQADRPGTGSTQPSASTMASAALAAGKKAPPPPPKKKNLTIGGLEGQPAMVAESDVPPPIPLASKPR